MYSPLDPYETGYIDAGSGHVLYYECCGNPDGVPAVYLHGGPGGGLHPDMRRFFDPARWRVILFDQRGAGKSRAEDIFRDNSPAHLVADMEMIRCHFGIEHWTVVGGSWGSTLAMLYATAYPQRVTAAVLTGIFFADRAGASWLAEEGGAARLMPEWFAPYRDLIPPERRGRGLIHAYRDIMMHGTEAEIVEAAKQFCLWDTALLYHDLPAARLHHVADNPHEYVALTKAFFHYAVNFYTDENRRRILNDVRGLEHIPCHIVHGRYDLICPAENAWELHRAWPGSALHILPRAGHTMRESDIAAKVVEITDEIASRMG